MFKTSSANTNKSSADISVIQTPCYSVGHDVLREISLLKNNVALLQADVHVLKSESRDKRDKSRSKLSGTCNRDSTNQK